MRPFLALLGALVAAPLLAAEPGQPLTPEEFDAATVGKTLYYNSAGQPYGVEQYLPGRKVIWAFLGDDCRKGEWYPEGNDICFVDPQCWTFYDSGSGLLARFRGDPASLPLIAVEESGAPMACMGPDVGV
jgi:hypothetical protein